MKPSLDPLPLPSTIQVKRDAKKTLAIHSLPQVLVVHLKRFQATYYGLKKLNQKVSFPGNHCYMSYKQSK